MILHTIGLIGDIHTGSESLNSALEVFHNLHTDAVLCTGDIVDGWGDVDECCRLLADHCVRVVRGNHNQWFLKNQMRDLPGATRRGCICEQSLAYLQALPAVLEFDTPQGPALLCHGIGSNDMAHVLPDDEGYALQSNEDLWAFLRTNR